MYEFIALFCLQWNNRLALFNQFSYRPQNDYNQNELYCQVCSHKEFDLESEASSAYTYDST